MVVQEEMREILIARRADEDTLRDFVWRKRGSVGHLDGAPDNVPGSSGGFSCQRVLIGRHRSGALHSFSLCERD